MGLISEHLLPKIVSGLFHMICGITGYLVNVWFPFPCKRIQKHGEGLDTDEREGNQRGFFSLKNYLFIFGCAGSSLLHGLFSSRWQAEVTL